MKSFKDDGFFELDSATVLEEFGVSGYVRFMYFKNPQYETMDYMQIRNDLLAGLTPEVLLETLKKKKL